MFVRFLPILLLISSVHLWGQAEFRVYNEHPRLWLDEARLGRLQRDAERETTRWMTLTSLLAQPAELREPAFANALAFQATGNEQLGRAAVDWALEATGRNFSEPGDLRQGSLVFDWCQPLLEGTEREKLVSGLTAAVEAAANSAELDLLDARDGLLGALALAGDWDGAEAAIGTFLTHHWTGVLLPQMESGKAADRADELQAALEICLAVRENLDRDLWSETPEVFRDVAMARILSYLPEDIDTPEGRARRPSVVPAGSDLETEAVIGRVAEMTLVSFDSTSRGSQFLQGWLRSDAYTLTGGYGALYEFLWLNPYLPGLSPSSGPQSAYDPTRGRLFARSGWGPDGLWLGYFDGELLRYEDGLLQPVEPENRSEAIAFTGFAIALTEETARLDASILEGPPGYPQRVYLLGLSDDSSYDVRIGKADWREYSPKGGVIVLTNAPELGLAEIDFHESQSIRIRPSKR